jgi:hypothetical protein
MLLWLNMEGNVEIDKACVEVLSVICLCSAYKASKHEDAIDGAAKFIGMGLIFFYLEISVDSCLHHVKGSSKCVVNHYS